MKSIRLLVLAGLLTAACGGDAFTVDVGTCFDDTGEAEISGVREVDCSDPHDREVFAVLDYAGTGTYPGSDAMKLAAQQLCIEAFGEYVGLPYEESAFEVFPITPTEGGWETGDREIICALYNLDFTKLTGSMKGAAR